MACLLALLLGAAGCGGSRLPAPRGFVQSGLVFGRPGCWRLRAHLAGHVLTVVLYVPGLTHGDRPPARTMRAS